MMRLSLSGRVIEVQYRYCELSALEFLRLARECGCTAVGGRAMLEGQVEEVLRFFGVEDRR